MAALALHLVNVDEAGVSALACKKQLLGSASKSLDHFGFSEQKWMNLLSV
jgi:hypothetical protein